VQGLEHRPAYRGVNSIYRKSLLIGRERILFVDFISLMPDSGVISIAVTIIWKRRNKSSPFLPLLSDANVVRQLSDYEAICSNLIACFMPHSLVSSRLINSFYYSARLHLKQSPAARLKVKCYDTIKVTMFLPGALIEAHPLTVFTLKLQISRNWIRVNTPYRTWLDHFSRWEISRCDIYLLRGTTYRTHARILSRTEIRSVVAPCTWMSV